ncbi:MAG: hypothetical protein ACK4M7_03985, partial [Burkholderiales bacterium]
EGIIKAILTDKLGSFSRTLELPVYFEIGESFATIGARNIHVVDPARNKQGYVYIGKHGLKGGIKEGKQEVGETAAIQKEENNQAAAVEEKDVARIQLADAILATTNAELDVRLNVYYKLTSALANYLKADPELKGGWNLLWQKAQEPELLINTDVYKPNVIDIVQQKEVLKGLEAAIQEIVDFKSKLTRVNHLVLNADECQKDLNALINFYEGFKNKLISVWQDADAFRKLVEPKALLMGEW